MAETRSAKIRLILAFVARVLQIVFCVACLACSARWTNVWWKYRHSTWQVHSMLQSVSLALFASVSGMLLSSFLLFAPRLVPKIAEDLPGLVDFLLSFIWSVLFLSSGASIVAWGACKKHAVCLVWKGTIGLSFFLWILYAISAVLAALDLKEQLDVITAASQPPAASAPSKTAAGKGNVPKSSSATSLTAAAARPATAAPPAPTAEAV